MPRILFWISPTPTAPCLRPSCHRLPQVYRTEYGRNHEPFFRGRDADYWRAFAPAAVDNYYTRLLLGEGTYYLPPGAITHEHMAAARLMLLQYDVLLILETSDMDELFLKHALGWRVGLSGASARVARHKGNADELMPYDLDDLVAANKLDVQLYGFGSVVHQLDGFMLGMVAAAGVKPYWAYDSLDPRDAAIGARVKCGLVSRADKYIGPEFNRTAVGKLPPVSLSDADRVYSADEGLTGTELLAALRGYDTVGLAQAAARKAREERAAGRRGTGGWGGAGGGAGGGQRGFLWWRR